MSHLPRRPLRLSHVFHCFRCRRNAPRSVKAVRIVLESRDRAYPLREKTQVAFKPNRSGKIVRVLVDDPGGRGSEIVREALACPACASIARI